MDIYALAERYGEPLNVLRVVETYGEVSAVQRALARSTLKRGQLETRIHELEKRESDLIAKIDEISHHVKAALEPLSSYVTTAIAQVLKASLDAIGKVETTGEDKIAQMNKTLEDYSTRLGRLNLEAGKLDREVEMGRIIWAALTDPAVAAEFSIDWVRTLVVSAQLFCQRKSFNPAVAIPHDLVKASNHLYLYSAGHQPAFQPQSPEDPLHDPG